MAEADEELARGYNLIELHRQPVHQEEVGAWAVESALPLLGPPVGLVKFGLPDLVVEGLDVERLSFGFVEDDVLKSSKLANSVSDRVSSEELRKWLENLNDEDLGRYKM